MKAFGVTHIARPEEWPIMPVEILRLHMKPVGFFDVSGARSDSAQGPHTDSSATPAWMCHLLRMPSPAMPMKLWPTVSTACTLANPMG